MRLIDNLTGFARQSTTLILDDGSTAVLELVFCGATNSWYFNLRYQGRRINGVALCCFPNVLRQWVNVLPFGIACVTADQTNPFNANDFQTGRVKLYLLNSDDVGAVETDVFTAP